MIILGIDPALAVSGYGVIEFKGRSLKLIEAGIIQTSAKSELPERLKKIFNSITNLIKETNPDVIVLEKIFSHYRHPVTSYLLGEARGVICLTAALQEIGLVEYAATRVKKAIVGNGLASKFQVQRMIATILKLDTLPKYTDVTDALALAIAHVFIKRSTI